MSAEPVHVQVEAGAGPETGYVDKALVAKKLEAAKAINITGDATGTANFDGSANADIEIILKICTTLKVMTSLY